MLSAAEHLLYLTGKRKKHVFAMILMTFLAVSCSFLLVDIVGHHVITPTPQPECPPDKAPILRPTIVIESLCQDCIDIAAVL